MATLITHLRSIPRNFVDAPKGKGFKAIGSALKAIFSPKKKESAQPPAPLASKHPSTKPPRIQLSDEQCQEITKIIEYLEDETNDFTDLTFGILQANLPTSVKFSIEQHLKTKNKTKANYIQFFKQLIVGSKEGLQFNQIVETWNIPRAGKSRPVTRGSNTKHKLSDIEATILSKVNCRSIRKILGYNSRKEATQHPRNYINKYGAGRKIDTILEEYNTLFTLLQHLEGSSISRMQLFNLEEKIPVDLKEKFVSARTRALRSDSVQDEKTAMDEISKLLSERINAKDFLAYIDARIAIPNRPLSEIVTDIIAVVKSRPDGFNTSQCQELIRQLPFDVRQKFLQHQIGLSDCLTQEAFLDFFEKF